MKNRGAGFEPGAPKRPNAVLYFVAFVLVYPVMKLLFGLEGCRKNIRLPKGPFVVLANHTTVIDFILVTLPFYPRRLNVVTAHKYFLNGSLARLLKSLGCIPKTQFDPDVRSVKSIRSVLKRGDNILMFPEGRCSNDGSFTGIHKSTGKFIKFLGVPVMACYIEGAYTCAPHWRKGVRAGRVRLSISELFSAEETSSLSADEINEAICARLSGADLPPPGKPLRTRGSRNLAEGLHRILYWCPKCGSEQTLDSAGNSIFCTACGNRALMDRDAKLTPSPGSVAPDSVRGWYREQTRYETGRLSEDMAPVCERVTVRMPAGGIGRGVEQCGAGTLRMGPAGWRYDGELRGEQVSLFFPVESVPVMAYEYDDSFQLYINGECYMFAPEDLRKCVNYSLIGECAHRRFSSRVQLTPGQNDGFYPAPPQGS